MEKQREVKALSVIALVVAVLGLTVAFAALSTTLTINGQATVKSGTWEVKFTDLTGPTTTGAAIAQSEPTIDDSGTKISKYDVTLTKPGDSVSYKFYVNNNGSIDAKIGTFSMEKPSCQSLAAEENKSDAEMVCKHLVYTLKYTGDSGTNNVAANDELTSEGKKQMELTIGYDIEAEEIPTDDVQVNIPDISIIYVQK